MVIFVFIFIFVIIFVLTFAVLIVFVVIFAAVYTDINNGIRFPIRFCIRICSLVCICIWIFCLRELDHLARVSRGTHSIWCDLIRRRRLRFSRRDLFNSKSVDILFMSVCGWHHRTLRPSVPLSVYPCVWHLLYSLSFIEISHSRLSLNLHTKKTQSGIRNNIIPRHYNTGLSATKGA